MYKNIPEIVFIYGLSDPRNSLIKYIGCCKEMKSRLAQHLSKRSLSLDSEKNIWLKELLSLNLKPDVVILEEVPGEEWENKERYWISFYGKENLTNMTGGGLGCLDCFPSKETREKISKSKLGDKNPFFGKKHTPESLEKISQASLGENNPMYGVSPSQEFKERKSKMEQGVKRQKNTTSQYVGISRPTGRRKWTAIINYKGKSIRIGNFETEVEAAIAYNKKAIELFGPDAKINIIKEG